MTEIGSILSGRYRLLELLGQGGMATIYRARDAQLERDVAVKVLRPEFGQDPDFLARFRDEARAAASLSHPNIVAVFDFGEDATDPYIVMELVDGQDLASILRENGPLAPRQAARIASDVAKALHAAHSRGIVHRDVKPSNILISRDGRVKVADFGIARALDDAQITLPGVTMGSVHYFAPEQARGEPATAASDVYALGIVLFEMLTGQRPFSGDGAAAVALARLTTTPPRPSALRTSVPPGLDAIVTRAMALNPVDRYASAAAMAGALDGFLADGGLGAAAAAGAAGMAPATTRPIVNYPAEAYARTGTPAQVSTRSTPPPPPGSGAAVPTATTAHYDEPVEEEGPGPWAWVAGLLGLGILILVVILAFRMLSSSGAASVGSPSASPSGPTVAVPNFVNKLYADASTQAASLGLATVRAATQPSSSAAADTVLSQDPAAGTNVPAGTTIKLTIAVGPSAVPVPDLRNMTLGDAANALAAVGLKLGTSTEAYDPTIPAGQIVAQDPIAGVPLAPGSAVNYTISKGPQPTPSPTPSPTPTPTPTPPPTPAPTPTPPPTPAPTPAPANVGNYVCLQVGAAKSAIVTDGFTVGTISPEGGTGTVTDTWYVSAQSPAPGTKQPAKTPIDLTAAATKPLTCP